MNNLIRKRASKEQSINDGNDVISLLPDCILHHILSLIPTKDAVATCAVSKRWKYLWTFVPCIDIDDTLLYTREIDYYCPPDPTSFVNFVERVLQLRNTSSMKRFRLYCTVCFSASRVNDWVSAAIRHNAEELDLCLFAEEPFTLPSRVFDNAFIKVLKLEMDCTLHLPPHISFSCLRTLHLSRVIFPNESLMQSLFSSFPSLEELVMLYCVWKKLKNIAITIPSLKNLVIDDTPFCSVGNLRGCEIKIDARNLMLFKYSGNLPNHINVHGLSSSALASIHVPIYCTMHQEIGNRTFDLFRGLRNVSNLRIFDGSIENLFRVENVISRLPVFHNLVLLELRGQLGKNSTVLLMKFLQFLPTLEFLHFCEGLGCGGDDLTLKLVIPNCIASTLKRVNYHNLLGTNMEICFLKFLLRNALVLEKMNVFMSKSYSRDPKNQEVRNELLAVSRGSSHCALRLHGKKISA